MWVPHQLGVADLGAGVGRHRIRVRIERIAAEAWVESNRTKASEERIFGEELLFFFFSGKKKSLGNLATPRGICRIGMA